MNEKIDELIKEVKSIKYGLISIWILIVMLGTILILIS